MAYGRYGLGPVPLQHTQDLVRLISEGYEGRIFRVTLVKELGKRKEEKGILGYFVLLFLSHGPPSLVMGNDSQNMDSNLILLNGEVKTSQLTGQWEGKHGRDEWFSSHGSPPSS